MSGKRLIVKGVPADANAARRRARRQEQVSDFIRYSLLAGTFLRDLSLRVERNRDAGCHA
jgi:hypothetical protein